MAAPDKNGHSLVSEQIACICFLHQSDANLTVRLWEARSIFSRDRECLAIPEATASGYCGFCFLNNHGRIMWIPVKTYEALPALYLTVGALIILGALYIGASHGLMPGYMLLGLSCVIAGVLVRNIRHNARSRAKPPLA